MNSGALWGINAIVQIGSMFWAPNQNIDQCNDLKPVMSSDVLGMTLNNPWRALEQLLKTLCINLLNKIWSFLNKPWINILESFLEKSWSLLNKSWTRSRRSTFWGRPWVNFWSNIVASLEADLEIPCCRLEKIWSRKSGAHFECRLEEYWSKSLE